MLELSPGRTPKAAELLASEVRSQILSRGLAAGTPLPSETEIIEQRGLSRATVREGLRLLEAEGLIEVRRGPRGGVVVGEPRPEHVARSLALQLTRSEATWRDLFAFRELVEPPAAAAAAVHATDEEREQLLRVADAGPEDNAYAHHEFHVLVAVASRNQIFSLVLAAIEQAVQWFSLNEDIDEWDLPGAAAAHKRIAVAVSKRDHRAAERVMRRHLDAFKTAAREAGIIDEPLLPRSRWSARARDPFGPL
jgi:GntR family transcriptional regulator, transcriptional repressor for pyruvate dehydrogenase complex